MRELVKKFSGQPILVVGDAMLDRYLMSRVERISPEAPIPIARVVEERETLGGAANVAHNIARMGGRARLLAWVGEDADGRRLAALGKQAGIACDLSAPGGMKTTQKTRVVSQSQQLLRIDHESPAPADEKAAKRLALAAGTAAKECAVVIVSDYAKGVVSAPLMEALRRAGKPLIVDPRPQNKALYAGADLITPNAAEAAAMTGLPMADEKDWEAAGARLRKELTAGILLTLGAHGARLFRKEGGRGVHIPSVAREVYDVSGAGDTVVAAIGLSLAAGSDLEEACRLANLAAGIKVGKFGTAPVSREELLEAIANGSQ